jgi:hypothetical protein
MNIKIEMNAEPVFRMLKTLPAEIVPLAASRALNKTAISAKSIAVKNVAANIGISQKEVRPFIQLCKATRVVLDVVVFASKTKRLPLIKIDPRAKQVATGISYRGAQGLRRTIPHAFIALMPTGHRGLYARKGGGRLPIIELFGPSIDYVFKRPLVQAAIEATVKTRWGVCCEQEIHFLLQQKGFR